MNKDNTGPAFPTESGLSHTKGMTLRDYFAAAALSSIAGAGVHKASVAYGIADAMLKARKA